MKENISAVVLTRNEAKNIVDCIANLKFCSEVIVIDDYSSDETVNLAERSGAKVFFRKLNKDFASQRNFGLQKATCAWALFIDADEIVSPELASEINQVVNKPEIKRDGYFLKRQDILWGKKLKHGEFGTISLLRLAKKNVGKWKRTVHEYWDVKGKIGKLDNPILHFPHQTLREFTSDINWHSTLHASANHKEGKDSNIFKIIFFPKLKFINNWIIKGGFLDGIEGFVAALMMSFHSFLAWSKQWIKQQEK